jgi:hypothetical protein
MSVNRVCKAIGLFVMIFITSVAVACYSVSLSTDSVLDEFKAVGQGSIAKEDIDNYYLAKIPFGYYKRDIKREFVWVDGDIGYMWISCKCIDWRDCFRLQIQRDSLSEQWVIVDILNVLSTQDDVWNVVFDEEANPQVAFPLQ